MVGNKNGPRTEYGIVFLADALGVSTRTMSGTNEFIENLNDLIDVTNEMASLFSQAREKGTLYPDSKDNNDIKIMTDVMKDWIESKTYTFGDTVVVTWSTTPESLRNVLVQFSLWGSHFMQCALKKGIAFRGVISVGEFVADDDRNLVLGPAVNDAAQWYEQADWLGVAATPHCAITLKRLDAENENSYRMDHIFYEYDVPTKHGVFKTFALPWMHRTDEIKDVAELLRLMENFPFPPGTESKYANTLKFIESIGDLSKPVHNALVFSQNPPDLFRRPQ